MGVPARLYARVTRLVAQGVAPDEAIERAAASTNGRRAMGEKRPPLPPPLDRERADRAERMRKLAFRSTVEGCVAAIRLDPGMAEAEFQRLVIDMARLCGWFVHHARPVERPAGGVSTPIAGDAGAPDLLLARGGVTLLVELKSRTGRLSPAQMLWREQADPRVYRLWRPTDIGEIQSELAPVAAA